MKWCMFMPALSLVMQTESIAAMESFTVIHFASLSIWQCHISGF